MTLRAIAHRFRPLFVVAALALSLPLLQACTTNPATGESEFTPFMSPEEEIQIGAQEHQKILAQFGGEYEDLRIQNYVSALGQELAAESELPDLKWTFTVLDSDIINAFALPGGYVYVTRGLVALADTEDQLAGVIGHEIGHVTARHAANRYSAAVGANLGVTGAAILADIFLGGGAGQVVAQGAGTVAQTALASYSRSQELQSDELGIRYLSRVGYDAQGMADFLDKMGREADLLAKLRDEAPRGFSYLDTHPPTEERVQEATELARANPGSGEPGSRKAYIEKIEGMIYGDSPDQGFRKGRRFIHPELRFAFMVPRDYHMMNYQNRVTATGPSGGGLTFSAVPEGASPDPVRFIAQQWAPKIPLQNLREYSENGLRGATGYAQVRTNRGAAFLRLAAVAMPDGRMYRFQFLAPASRAQQADREFQEVLQSFRRLSAEEARTQKPYRIYPYQVRRGDSIAGLAAKLPFERLAEERLRVLNGLDNGKIFQPGLWIKMVAAR